MLATTTENFITHDVNVSEEWTLPQDSIRGLVGFGAVAALVLLLSLGQFLCRSDRTSWQTEMRERLKWHRGTSIWDTFDRWKCNIKCTWCKMFGLLEYMSASLKAASAHLPVSRSVSLSTSWKILDYVKESLFLKYKIIFSYTFDTFKNNKITTACMSLVEWLEIILRIDDPIWTNMHFYVHSAASCFF